MGETPGYVPKGAQGDFKADTIVWKPFGDRLPGQLILIAQATISEGDWIHDEPPNRWAYKDRREDRLIRFLARPVTAVAFPETLSLIGEDMLNGLQYNSIPFDRLRLVSVIYDDEIPNDLRVRMSDWCRAVTQSLPR